MVGRLTVIRRGGLNCLKVKLRCNDAAWDYDRLVKVGVISLEHNVLWLTSDFNCTVTDPATYVKIHLSTKRINPSHLLRSAAAQFSPSFGPILSVVSQTPSVVSF